jgi:hypothetical protein
MRSAKAVLVLSLSALKGEGGETLSFEGAGLADVADPKTA